MFEIHGKVSSDRHEEQDFEDITLDFLGVNYKEKYSLGEQLRLLITLEALNSLEKAVNLTITSQGNSGLLIRKLTNLIEEFQFDIDHSAHSEQIALNHGLRSCLLIIVKISSLFSTEIPIIGAISSKAITILNAARVIFSGMDLSNIHIPSADLSYGIFDSTQFQYADLRDVIFRAAWLRRANFNFAKMDGIRFEERSFLSESPLNTGCFVAENTILLGQGNNIVLLNIHTFEILRTFSGHTDLVTTISLCKNKKMFISGGADKTARLWMLETGNCLHVFPEQAERISVALSPTENLIALGNQDKGTVALWSTDNAQLVHQFPGKAKHLYSHCAVFSNDGSRLAVGGNAIDVYDVSSKQLVAVLTNSKEDSLRGNGVNSIVFSPDNQLLASGGADRAVSLWNIRSKHKIYCFKQPTNHILSLAFSPDGKQLAAGTGNLESAIWLWAVESKQIIRKIVTHKDSVIAVDFNSTGEELVSISNDKSVRFWGLLNLSLKGNFEDHTGSSIKSVILNPDGTKLISGSNDGSICLWNMQEKCLTYKFEGHSDSILSIALNPDEIEFASGSSDRTIRLWNVDNLYNAEILDSQTSAISSLAFHPNGQILAAAFSWEKIIQLIHLSANPKIKNLVLSLAGHLNFINSIAFSSGGDFLASGGGGFTAGDEPEDNSVRLWNTSDGQLIFTFIGHQDWVESVIFTSDDKKIISGSRDKIIRLWDIEAQILYSIFEGHQGWVTSLAISVCIQNLIISSSSDSTVRFWDLNTSLCAFTIKGFIGEVNSISFIENNEGMFLATGDNDAAVRYWQISCNNGILGAQLIWANRQEALVVHEAYFNKQTLPLDNINLLKTRGGLFEDDNFLNSTSLLSNESSLNEVPNQSSIKSSKQFSKTDVKNHVDYRREIAKYFRTRIEKMCKISGEQSRNYVMILMPSKRDSLASAVEQGKIIEIRQLGELKHIVNLISNHGHSLLFIAISKRYTEVVNILLEHGANVNETDIDGRASLYLAAATGQEEVVKFLLEKGARPDQADNIGVTPYHIAKSERHYKIADLLLEEIKKRKSNVSSRLVNKQNYGKGNLSLKRGFFLKDAEKLNKNSVSMTFK